MPVPVRIGLTSGMTYYSWTLQARSTALYFVYLIDGLSENMTPTSSKDLITERRVYVETFLSRDLFDELLE